MSHKHDPGAYHALLFSAQGRRRSQSWALRNRQHGLSLIRRWVRRTGGSGVVMRCVYNSASGTNDVWTNPRKAT